MLHYLENVYVLCSLSWASYLLLFILTHTHTCTHPCQQRTAKAAGQTDRAIHQTDMHTQRNSQREFTEEGIKQETG